MDKLKKIGGIAVIIALVIVIGYGWIIDAYTYVMGMSWKHCSLDGEYIYHDKDAEIAVIFDEDEMRLYFVTNTTATRLSYKYSGTYYNKGLFGKFLTTDKKWIEIPDAKKAGVLYADCKFCVSSDHWGNFEYLDEEEIEYRGEKDGINYSKIFFFKINGDELTLIIDEDDESFSIPLTQAFTLTGDLGDSVEYLDSLWEGKFGK